MVTPLSDKIKILLFSLYSTTFKETGSVTYVSHLLQGGGKKFFFLIYLTRMEKEIFAELDKLKKEMADSLIQLVKIPAISPESGGEGEGKNTPLWYFP